MRLRTSTTLRAAALLLLFAAAGATLDDDQRYKDPPFLSPLAVPGGNASKSVMNLMTVIRGFADGMGNLPGAMRRGDTVIRAPGGATPEVELTDIGCLNTVVPEPLNWGPLWCAGREAKVTQWTDAAGAIHRKVYLPPQANVTVSERGGECWRGGGGVVQQPDCSLPRLRR